VIDRLEKKGWITRTPNPKDKRAKLVSLSQAGEALYLQLLPEVKSLQNDILGGLDDQQKQLFMQLAATALGK
jgi:DNA-binding MarR family transcriptional regulator